MGTKSKITTKHVVLSLPFFAAFIWFVSLIANTNSAQQTLQLSPGRFNALVTVLFLFIVIYGALLFYIFRALKKEEGIEEEMKQKVKRIKARSEVLSRKQVKAKKSKRK